MNRDQVTIDVFHAPLWLTISTLILTIIVMFCLATLPYVPEAFGIFLLMVGGAALVIIVGFWPTRLRLDASGITYRRWLPKKTIRWNDLTDVLFEILPPPDERDPRDLIGEGLGIARVHRHTDLDAAIAAAGLFSPIPSFQCSMTFSGDKVIVMKTERYDGPSAKEFWAALDYVNSRLEYFDFEIKMTRHRGERWKGPPQLLKPV